MNSGLEYVCVAKACIPEVIGRVPLYLYTGFLGQNSGNCRLIRHLIAALSGRQWLVNKVILARFVRLDGQL